MYQSVKDTAINHPDFYALNFMKKYMTYQELLTKIDSLASGFTEFGLGKGDTCTLAMPNVFEAIFSFYALNKIGVVCHMVHPLTPIPQMDKFMEQTKSKTLVILDTFYGHYDKLLLDKLKKFILVNPTDEFGRLKKIGYKLINMKTLKRIEYDERVVKISNLYKNSDIETSEVDAKDTAVLLHSGGTSGQPKTIELSSFAINYLASLAPEILHDNEFKDKHMLAVLPMFHGFGLCMGVHGMLMHGGIDTLMPKFNAKQAINLIRDNKCNYIIGVPSLFEALLREEEFHSEITKNIHQAFVGGDYVAQDLKDRFNHIMEYYYSDARLLEGYGLTEVVTVCAVNTLDDSKKGTVGKPVRGVEVKIINAENMEFLSPGTPGEIVVKGPTMMNGYLNDAEATNNTIIDIDGEKWVRTGDLGLIDETGYVVFKQRLKRIVKVSGIPVLPAEIENFLMSRPEIAEVAAVGVPDHMMGFAIKLFVVWNKGRTPLSDNEIRTLIKDNISRYAEPKEIVVMNALPKTIIGKVNILELEKM